MSSRLCAALLFALSTAATASAAGARPAHRPALVPMAQSHRVAFMGYLRDGRTATVYADGEVTLVPSRSPARAQARGRAPRSLSAAAPVRMHVPVGLYGSLEGEVPAATRRRILFDLEHPPVPYAPERVIVAFGPNVTVPRDSDALSPAAARSLRAAVLAKRRDLVPHPFTNDARTNAALMSLGVDRADRLFGHLDRGSLSALRARAESRARRALVAFDNAFVLHVGAASVDAAVRKLRALPGVTYAAPDRAVSAMIAGRRPLGDDTLREIAGYHRAARTFGRSVRSTTSAVTVPPNTAVSLSFQALLNSPGVDAVAAFDEIGARFNQLPGAGEIVTNVGLGDADDASAAADPSDPCNDMVNGYGATTRVVGGQRYLDWPSLPLIPVWVSDANGTLSPTAEVCGVDPQLGEVGLDFSMMAPLPDALQRPGKAAPFAMDLLGIAPGASYRWVAPGATNGVVGMSDVLAAMLGAARQQPAPNVITASIGFGADGVGFPSRYLEDDPLAESIVGGIVASNVVVCIAANDGTRLITTAAVGPSGGSAATNVGTATTNVQDLYYTTAPSVDTDSGAIDVGSTTLDDVASANPQDPALAALANVKTFAETRFNGMLGFSSGFGTRVNVSAPGDNVNGLFHAGTDPDAVGIENAGGTSASAPEVAAAAAVALQVARLSGHPLTSAAQVRDLLVATGTPVANPPQADVNLNVGPQVSVRRVVERLLAAAGHPVDPGIARVAIQGRRSGNIIAAFNERFVNDSVFTTALDPSFIKLDGPFTQAVNLHRVSWPGSDTGADLNSYVTIAPDWEGIPANATYRLTVAGQPARVIATTPYARLLPAQLFAAAGVPLTPGVSRTLSLTYRASVGLHAVAESTFQLTFGPPAASSRLVLAPYVPPVVSGSTIPVTYDVRGYPADKLRAPALVVSMPGIGSLFFQGIGLYPYYTMPLPDTHGTVNVPVSALAGAGTYTLWIDLQPGTTAFGSDISDLAFTRVDAGTARPAAPLLSLPHDTSWPPLHNMQVPYRSPFIVTYDVSNVPGATGAIVELAAPPPSPVFYHQGYAGGLNTFRNPNGNTLDDDGVITGSLYHVRASGVTGSVTIDPVAANIPVTATANIRVLPANGAGPIAEASDAGTIQYDGIAGATGLPIAAVYMNQTGSDGYLVELGYVGSPQVNAELALLEPFDVQSGALGALPLALTSQVFDMAYYPFVQNDVALAATSADGTTVNYLRGAPPSSGFSAFSFPPGSLPSTAFIYAAAPTSSATRSAYIAQDLATGDYLAARGDVIAGTGFSAPVDLTAAFGPNFDPYGPFSFDYDPVADRAYFLMEDQSLACDQQSPKLVTVDFAVGSATARTLPIHAGDTHGMYRLAIDPGTHVAAITTSCSVASTAKYQTELTLLDLSTGATTQAYQHELGVEMLFHGGFMLGGDSPVVGIDAVNHLILQRSMLCPAVLGNFDLNARVCLNEYDETGRLVKTVPGLFSDGDTGSPSFSGVNGSTRMSAAPGQEANYYGQSFAVQPYTY